MPREKKIVTVPFTAGIQQKSDARTLDPPGFVSLVNARFLKDGALDVRAGQVEMTVDKFTSGYIDAPLRVFANGEQLVAADRNKLAAFGGSVDDANDKWESLGDVGNSYQRAIPIASTGTSGGAIVSARVGDYVCFAVPGADLTGITVSVHRATADLPLVWSDFVKTTAVITCLSAVAFNGYFCVGYGNSAAGVTELYRIDPTRVNGPGTTTLSNAFASAWVDLSASTNRLGVAITDGVNCIFETWSTAFANIELVSVVKPGTPVGSCIGTRPIGEQTDTAIAYSNAGVTTIYLSSDALLATGVWGAIGPALAPASGALAPLMSRMCIVPYGDDGTNKLSAFFFPNYVLDTSAGGAQYPTTNTTLSTITSTLAGYGWTENTYIFGARPYSKPSFIANEPDRLVFAVDVTLGASGVDTTNTNPYLAVYRAKVSGAWVFDGAPKLAGYIGLRACASGATVMNSCAAATLTEDATLVVASPGFGHVDQMAWTLDMGDDNERKAWLSASVLDVNVASGSLPGSVDSSLAYEYGFANAPSAQVERIIGGGAMSAGTYMYAFTYSWRDDKGNLSESEAYLSGQSVTVVANDRVQCLVWYYQHTAKMLPGVTGATARSPVMVNIYRTSTSTPPGDDAGVYYYVGSIKNVVRDATTPSGMGAFVDTYSYATVRNSVPLYITGGVLDDQMPPALSCVAAHKGRLFGANGATVYYSKKYVANSVPGFNDVLTVSVPEGGDITGLASMDSALIVFKADRIFAVSGEGQTDLGTQDDMQPQRVTVQTGCVDSRSIVSTTDGVMFQATDGIYLLDRSYSLKYIGAPAEDAFDGKTIASAWYYAPQAQVRWTFTDGNQAVYDTTFGRWTTYTQPAVDDLVTNASSCVWRGMHVVAGKGVDSDGPIVLLEDGGPDERGGGDIVMSGETAPVKLGGLQGFQRVRRTTILGRLGTASDFSITASQSYGQTSETWTWTAAQAAAAAVGTRLQVERHMAYQKGEAISFSFTQNAKLTSGVRGFSFEGFTLEVVVDSRRFMGLAAASRD